MVEKQAQEKFDENAKEFKNDLEAISKRFSELQESIPDFGIEQLLRQDLIKTLKSINEQQIVHTNEVISSHIEELKNHMGNTEFKNHKEKIRTISALIRNDLDRLEQHKSGEIINEIRYEKSKSK